MDKNIIILYNPKTRIVNGEEVINKTKASDQYGARKVIDGNRDLGPLIEKPQRYELIPGEIKKFRRDVGEYLLKKFTFLEEVSPEKLVEKLEELKEKSYKCDKCDYETNHKIALIQHEKGNHSISEEAQALLESIPTAGSLDLPDQDFSVQPQVSADEASGLPQTFSNDPRHAVVGHDGVAIYGEGLVEDRSGMSSRPRKRSQIL